MSTSAYAVIARTRKVHAVRSRIEELATDSGFNPVEPEVAKGIAEQLEKADDKGWAQLEREAGQKQFSALSRLMLVNIFRERAGLPPLAAGSLGGPSGDAGSGASHREGKQGSATNKVEGAAGTAPAAPLLCEECQKPVDYTWWSRTCVSCDAKTLVEHLNPETQAEIRRIEEETNTRGRHSR